MSITERRDAVLPRLYRILNHSDCRLYDCKGLGYVVGAWDGKRWRVSWFDKMRTLKGDI